MTTTTGLPKIDAGSIPELGFIVQDAGAAEYAAVPTLRFGLRIDSLGGHPIRSVVLDVQLQIAARLRPYDDAAQKGLLEVFGTPDRWRDTLRTLPWTRMTVVVPQFTQSTVVDLPVICTYDLEVTASRYFQALSDGEVPLEFLFSGTVFYSTPEGQLQTVRISWEQDASYALPVAVWREAMDRHFPNSAWLRLDRDVFDRLCAYKARHTLPTWEATLDALLPAASEG